MVDTFYLERNTKIDNVNLEILNKEIEQYIALLTTKVTGIRQIWLIGSRANGREHADSDWDFIVFSDPQVFQEITNNCSLHASNVDLLLVGPDKTFQRPWGDLKNGSLESWEWKQVAPTKSIYIGTKWIPDQEAIEEGLDTLGYPLRETLNAVLVWPSE